MAASTVSRHDSIVSPGVPKIRSRLIEANPSVRAAVTAAMTSGGRWRRRVFYRLFDVFDGFAGTHGREFASGIERPPALNAVNNGIVIIAAPQKQQYARTFDQRRVIFDASPGLYLEIFADGDTALEWLIDLNQIGYYLNL